MVISMSDQYTIHFLENNEELPRRETISAVFLIAFHKGKVLSIQNERGWDIPGGHLEENENPVVGLRREVLEEAGVLVKVAKPYAVLSSPPSPKVMLFFVSDSIELVQFVPTEDALDRALLNPDELIGRYYGDKELLRTLIEGGQTTFYLHNKKDTL